ALVQPPDQDAHHQELPLPGIHFQGPQLLLSALSSLFLPLRSSPPAPAPALLRFSSVPRRPLCLLRLTGQGLIELARMNYTIASMTLKDVQVLTKNDKAKGQLG